MCIMEQEHWWHRGRHLQSLEKAGKIITAYFSSDWKSLRKNKHSALRCERKAFARADWTKLDSKVRGQGDVHSFRVVSLYIDISILLWRKSYLSQAGTKLTEWLKMTLILLTLSLQWLDYKPLPACRFCGSYFLINEEAAAVNQLRVVWQHKDGTPMFMCFHLMALL